MYVKETPSSGAELAGQEFVLCTGTYIGGEPRAFSSLERTQSHGAFNVNIVYEVGLFCFLMESQ